MECGMRLRLLSLKSDCHLEGVRPREPERSSGDDVRGGEGGILPGAVTSGIRGFYSFRRFSFHWERRAFSVLLRPPCRGGPKGRLSDSVSPSGNALVVPCVQVERRIRVR